MPSLFQGPLRYAILTTTFVDEAVYVWVATLVRFKHEEMAEVCGRVLSDALHKELQLFPDLVAPLTKAFVSFVSVEIDPGSKSPFTSTFQEVVCSVWPKGKCGEPRAHAYLYFGGRAKGPILRTLLFAPSTLTAPHPTIKVEWALREGAVNDNSLVVKDSAPSIVSKLDGDNTECP